jgi:hypothetical protein
MLTALLALIQLHPSDELSITQRAQLALAIGTVPIQKAIGIA